MTADSEIQHNHNYVTPMYKKKKKKLEKRLKMLTLLQVIKILFSNFSVFSKMFLKRLIWAPIAHRLMFIEQLTPCQDP